MSEGEGCQGKHRTWKNTKAVPDELPELLTIYSDISTAELKHFDNRSKITVLYKNHKQGGKVRAEEAD